MATATTHAKATETCNVHIQDALLPLKDACSRMLEDESIKNDTDGSIICRKMAHDFMCLLEHPNQETAELATWLCTQLQKAGQREAVEKFSQNQEW